jgi:hypothetical protein
LLIDEGSTYMTASPTPAFRGSPLGPALCVLSRPEIRSAQQIAEPTRYDTRDGLVDGRPGEIAMTAYGKEQYPIRREIFLGAYEILGRVGPDLVAERLIHVRRAWEVLGDGGTFDYGPGRGVVAVERGSWLCESDDGDFGTIHPSVKEEGHLVVGPEEAEDRVDWRVRAESWSTWLSALPPVLTLLALSAFVAALRPSVPHNVATALIGTEVLLLLAGAAAVWTMRRQRWFLRACVQTAIALGREFESAVELLGHPLSARFPGMAMWRAAQARPADAGARPRSADDAALLQSLHEATVRRLRLLDDEMHHAHWREAAASWATLVAFGLVLAANVALLVGPHLVVVELLAIWIPALVSAIHSFDWRRRTAERVTAMCQLADRLRFAQQRLLADGRTPGPARDAVLRVLCAAAAQHSQHELKLALAAEAPLPV